VFETRRARKILRNGGPKTAKEYFFLFPLACPSCGSRNAEHTRIELDHSKRWNSFGGFNESHYSGWKECTRCRRCNCEYAVQQSVFFDTVYPDAKDIRTLGPSSIRTENSNVNWHKIVDIEGFKVDDMSDEIPDGGQTNS